MPLILLTGLPGVGKTTVVQAVARAVAAAFAEQPELAGRRAAGFVTEEVLAGAAPGPGEAGGRRHRVGFDVVDLDTQHRAPLARLRDPAVRPPQKGPRMGKWVVDSAAFGKLAKTSLDASADVYIVDEIGKMELFVKSFVDRTRTLCSEAVCDMGFTLATVALKGTGFIADVKAINSARLIEVTPENRDCLPSELAQEIIQWCVARPHKSSQGAAAAAAPAPAAPMTKGGGKTVQASVCLIPDGALWPGIQAIREKHDKHLVRWMPHINLLYPFVPIEEFDAAAEKLAEGLRSVCPFELRFDQLGVFHHSKKSHTFWLDPETNAGAGGGECPLTHLYHTLLTLFPHCDDTNSKEGGFRPHLSLGQAKGPPPNMASLSALWPGGKYTVSSVYLIYRADFNDPFHVRRVVSLGDNASAGVPGDWMYTAKGEAFWRNMSTGSVSNNVPTLVK
eukprot:m.25635 g.25635  ORF g.25635 m.25635 type:complete len:449 (-) comp6219_c0_seq1:1853-3199(-)